MEFLSISICCHSSIYIPIWFYSNLDIEGELIYAREFTFQYGSIQIIAIISILELHPTFTFQYGSIQIDLALEYVDRYVNLHSNMVLFKWVAERTGQEKYSLFTFQYGSIQIKDGEHSKVQIKKFTFQYGSIQIKEGLAYFEQLNKFTFQYGSIQIN